PTPGSSRPRRRCCCSSRSGRAWRRPSSRRDAGPSSSATDGPVPQGLPEPSERGPPVADPVLLLRRELCHGQRRTIALLHRDEDRVVAEAARATRLQHQQAFTRALGPPLGAARPGAGRNALVPRGATLRRDVADALDEQLEVLLLRGAGAGEPGGAWTGSAAERVDLDARVVGERRH